MKIPTWQEVYKLPLKLEYYTETVFTSEREHAFDFYSKFAIDKKEHDAYHFLAPSIQSKVVNMINGNADMLFSLRGELTYKDAIIYLNDKKFIYVRGWGSLTGITGGHNLNDVDARKIQDDFAAFIISQLKGNL